MAVGTVGLQQERIGLDGLRQIQHDPELPTGTDARSYPGDKPAGRRDSGRQGNARIREVDDKPIRGLEGENPVRRGR